MSATIDVELLFSYQKISEICFKTFPMAFYTNWATKYLRFRRYKKSTVSGTQPKIFTGRGDFVELGHFDDFFRQKHKKKRTRREKFWSFFSWNTFWMKDSNQGCTQLGPFSPKSGHFFRFSKKGRGGLPPTNPSCAWIYSTW